MIVGLIIRVEDVMHKGAEIPKVLPNTKLLDAIREMSHKSLGLTAIVDEQNNVLGVLTEGDLRKIIQSKGDIRPLIINQFMTKDPKTISPKVLAVEAAKSLSDFRINQLLVVDGSKLVGIITTHDLIHNKII